MRLAWPSLEGLPGGFFIFLKTDVVKIPDYLSFEEEVVVLRVLL